jgi:phospholipid-binding lipoprotein MlaA
MTAHTGSSLAGSSGLCVARRARRSVCLLAGYLGVALVAGAPITSAAQVAANPTTAPANRNADPWQRENRVGYAVQGKLDHYLIHPLSRVYRWLTPGPIGRGIHNVLVNLSEPAALLNDLLQFRLKRAATPAARLVVNSTVGILGLVDVAGRYGLQHHDNEFGVTLGRYGFHSGPYLYLPMIGPSTVRDLVGGGVDFVLNPLHWFGYPVGYPDEARFAVGGLDQQVSTEADLNALLSTAVDPYAALRSAYLQHKQGEIDGDGVPLDLPSFDEPAAVPQPAPATKPTPTVASAPAATCSDDCP